MYTYGWFMLRFDRRQQNSVKQLPFNEKINNFNKKYLFLKCFNFSKIGAPLWWENSYTSSLSIPLPSSFC